MYNGGAEHSLKPPDWGKSLCGDSKEEPWRTLKDLEAWLPFFPSFSQPPIHTSPVLTDSEVLSHAGVKENIWSTLLYNICSLVMAPSDHPALA